MARAPRRPRKPPHLSDRSHRGRRRRERAALAALLVRLARRSARPHICLTLDRAERPPRGALHLEPMGITSMTSMLYIDPDYGPSSEDVFEAAPAFGRPARRAFSRSSGRGRSESARHLLHGSRIDAAYGSASESPGAAAHRAEAIAHRIGAVACQQQSVRAGGAGPA